MPATNKRQILRDNGTDRLVDRDVAAGDRHTRAAGGRIRSNKWAGKTALVTGATGLLGGWLVRSLLARGTKVIAVVRSPKPRSQFSLEGLDRQVQIESGSVYVHGFVREVIQRTQPDYLFHTADGAGPDRVFVEPLECFRSGVESTWLALDTIRKLGRPCVSVISSSDKAYGSPSRTVPTTPYQEDTPLTPRHLYEVCKASLDLAAQSYGKMYQLPVGITRCATFFGPYDFNFTRLIPRVIRSIVEGELPVLGVDDYVARDYLSVEEAAEAQLLLAERLSEDATLYGEAFNLSYGNAVNITDIVQRVIEILGADLAPAMSRRVRAQVRPVQLSSGKAQRLLNWTPQAGFEERLRATVRWYQTYLTASSESSVARVRASA